MIHVPWPPQFEPLRSPSLAKWILYDVVTRVLLMICTYLCKILRSGVLVATTVQSLQRYLFNMRHAG